MPGFKYIVFCGDVPEDGKLSSRVAKFIASVVRECGHSVHVFGKKNCVLIITK